MWVQPLFSCLDFCSPVFPLKRVCLEVKGEDISMIACMQRLSFHHQIFYFSPLGLSYLHTGWKMEWYPCQVESNLICTKGKKEGIIRSLYSYARTYTGDAYGFTSTYTVVFNFLSPPCFCTLVNADVRWACIMMPDIFLVPSSTEPCSIFTATSGTVCYSHLCLTDEKQRPRKINWSRSIAQLVSEGARLRRRRPASRCLTLYAKRLRSFYFVS